MTVLRIGVLALFATLFATVSQAAEVTRIALLKSRFSTGDVAAWSAPGFDDSAWKELSTTANYEKQGFAGYDGYAWYRIHVVIPSALKQSVYWPQRLRLFLSAIDDVDQTWFNGVRVGETGRFPGADGAYDTKWQAEREYFVDVAGGTIRWDEDNVIAIRLFDGSGGGGFYKGQPYLNMAELIDGVKLDATKSTFTFLPGGRVTTQLAISNEFPVTLDGTLKYEVMDAATGKVLERRQQPLKLAAAGSQHVAVTTVARPGVNVRYQFVETRSGKSAAATHVVPYLLTPAVAAQPRINGAAVLGVRAGSPVLHRIAATGRPPLKYAARVLPAGLKLDADSGIISGTLAGNGRYAIDLQVSNALGTARRSFTIVVGDTLALTPPMGWNSWNVYGLGVTDTLIRGAAQAMVDKGLAAHGWTYINIDDGWEADTRAADGEIGSNHKFPDMVALGTAIHDQGLKFGIYSSPGPLTCGRFLGSIDHERQDAATYARWGVDYLKYDLCSYEDLMSPARTLEEHQKPYRVMGAALATQTRDIIFSMCQYGNQDPWNWAASVRGNSWRTTGDIEDSWTSVVGIGFDQQYKMSPYASPGHWNDPDMLVVGMVGWGGALHPSRLSPDEQYSHISLWSLLASPLLLGNDLASLDEFTLNLLTNDEVIAINQDPLGRAARRVFSSDDWQVWVRDLQDGGKAVGIFNLGDGYRSLRLSADMIGHSGAMRLRDAWRQAELGRFASGYAAAVPSHGVLLLTVR
jgi:hypothetical protein